ncbi:DNA N6-methyl adenine demethylase [Caenorhabditis elegans]|uniref:Isoform b of DNA N6-methyl adenine demethylase n=1 Tax=Caenorhabditis elegans TaxID=6239 RepID=Q8MNT9-2|nr:DNA N6-methyl adenine demethylase [Caenorhabditis elegans]CCD68391.1 DNA N6-methyl adenine demethylase [Caenorhabditis elegans]|eukprot:NP_741142.1 DNA N6-methyl adenine demethylase [Caenorhabditis elegans]
MGSAEQACGCKGARFCALCETTERVKKLRVVEDKHVNYKVFIYDHIRQIAIPTTNLNSQSSLEDIIDESTSCQSVSTDGSIEIDGLTLIHNFLSESEESKILNMIDTVEWAQSQSGRRKQDYGPKVNFKHKKVKTDTFVGMPEYADMLLNKMSEYDVKKLGNYQPFEMCNLEYEEVKKSAIEMHQDDMWIWGNRLIRYEFLFKKVLFN